MSKGVSNKNNLLTYEPLSIVSVFWMFYANTKRDGEYIVYHPRTEQSGT